MASKLSYLTSPCMWCVRAAKWLPVLFIVAVIVWSYYAYVIQLNILTIDVLLKKIFYLLVYHVLLAMFVWSYWQTVFSNTGSVPKQFRLPSAELESYLGAESEDVRRETLERFCQKQLLPVTNRTLTGDIRFCDKCCHVKPDRCHHCSVCGECVLKMDHHCPWVNNCVSFTNYKFFVLFLGYALIYCLFVGTTTLEYFIKFWTNELTKVPGKFHILFVFFVSIMFAISLVSLFGYHIFLITRNRSTLESFRAPIFRLSHSWVHDKEGFSLGSYNNFIEIFGDNKRNWFLPIFTSAGDGILFPLRCRPIGGASPAPPNSSSSPTTSSPQAQSYGSTNTSLGDGVSYPQRVIDEDMDGLLGSGGRWADEESATVAANYNSPSHYNGTHQLDEVIVDSNHTNPV